jgi:hypothetical protein
VSAETYLRWLREDTGNTLEARRWLERHGAPPGWFDDESGKCGLLGALARARNHFELNASAPERKKRRHSLAEQLRRLAGELQRDPDASTFYPHYGRGELRRPTVTIDHAPFECALTLSDWLRECGEHLEALPEIENVTRSLQRYLIHAAHHELLARWRALHPDERLPQTPRKAITGLVTALLVDKGDVEVNDKTVSNTLAGSST